MIQRETGADVPSSLRAILPRHYVLRDYNGVKISNGVAEAEAESMEHNLIEIR